MHILRSYIENSGKRVKKTTTKIAAKIKICWKLRRKVKKTSLYAIDSIYTVKMYAKNSSFVLERYLSLSVDVALKNK